jgi:hypothetical protein
MTDYITFVGEEAISVEEYIDEEHKGKIKCICGKEVHFVNESCFFERRGVMVQKTKHFSHFKGEKCFIPKDKIERKESNELEDKPELTLKDKRFKRIKKLTIKHLEDLKTLNYNRAILKNIIDKAKYHKIDYEEEIKKQDLISKFYNGIYNLNINNYECISFKELINIKIEPNKIYRINEINYTYIYKKRDNNVYDYISISSSYFDKIITDYDLYCKYLKQLSLIIIYYSSRCNRDNVDIIKNDLEILEHIINEKIHKKKIEKENKKIQFIED